MDKLSSIKSQPNTLQSESLSSGVTKISENLREVKLLRRRDFVRLQGSVSGTSYQNYINSICTERNTSVNNQGNSEYMTTGIYINHPLHSSLAATADDNAMNSKPAASQETT